MAYTKGLKKVNLFKLIEESKITDNVKSENVHCVLHIHISFRRPVYGFRQ